MKKLTFSLMLLAMSAQTASCTPRNHPKQAPVPSLPASRLPPRAGATPGSKRPDLRLSGRPATDQSAGHPIKKPLMRLFYCVQENRRVFHGDPTLGQISRESCLLRNHACFRALAFNVDALTDAQGACRLGDRHQHAA